MNFANHPICSYSRNNSTVGKNTMHGTCGHELYNYHLIFSGWLPLLTIFGGGYKRTQNNQGQSKPLGCTGFFNVFLKGKWHHFGISHLSYSTKVSNLERGVYHDIHEKTSMFCQDGDCDGDDDEDNDDDISRSTSP